MATEISLIASLLHLRCIDNGIEARQAVESGSYLVREDDVKAVVVKLRAAHDKSRDEMEAMRERAEKAEAQLASITGVTRLELVAAERAKREPLVALLKECTFHLLALHLRGESQTAGPLAARVGDALKTEAAS